MEKVKIRKNSWHWKLYENSFYVREGIPEPTNVCSYMRQVLLGLFYHLISSLFMFIFIPAGTIFLHIIFWIFSFLLICGVVLAEVGCIIFGFYINAPIRFGDTSDDDLFSVYGFYIDPDEMENLKQYVPPTLFGIKLYPWKVILAAAVMGVAYFYPAEFMEYGMYVAIATAFLIGAAVILWELFGAIKRIRNMETYQLFSKYLDEKLCWRVEIVDDTPPKS